MLVVSNTNITVERVYERAFDGQASSSRNTDVDRYGTAVRDMLRQAHEDRVALDAIVAGLTESLQGEKEDAERGKVAREAEAISLRRALEDLRRLK